MREWVLGCLQMRETNIKRSYEGDDDGETTETQRWECWELRFGSERNEKELKNENQKRERVGGFEC